MQRGIMFPAIWSLLVCLLAHPLAGQDGEPATSPASSKFEKEIQPIFRKHCYQCHGRDVQEAGLRLDRRADALRGGENGKVILPGKGAESSIVKIVSGRDADERIMPPEDEAPKLLQSQISALQQWIDDGSVWPDGVDGVGPAIQAPWSFRPLTRPTPPPKFQGDEWVRNPIDAFVLARLRAAKIEPSAAATANELARRAALDITGLPLSLEQLDDFERAAADNPDAAYADLVQRLLNSSHYGERWGRHWLDVARYADSNGYEVDGEKPMAWKYRDYVIKALNDDKPYNRFVLEQLAGDELSDATAETVIATGFLRVGPWDAERGASVQPSEVIAERFNELDDLVSTTGQVFLGMTLGCARCHDHKFDPLDSRDYYSLVAIFSPLKRHNNGRTELTRAAVPPRELGDKNAADKRIAELAARRRELDAPLRRGLIETGATKLPDDAVAALKAPADKRSDAQKQLVQRFASTFDGEVSAALKDKATAAKFLSDEAIAAIAAAVAETAELTRRFDYPEGYFFYEPSPLPPVTHLLKRGNPKQPGEVVGPAAPRAIAAQAKLPQPTFGQPDAFTSRRRIALAQWIAADANPLTPRVMVNRIWQHHFGVGIVRSPSDFGNGGSQPTHPQLLDWLAHWFVHDADWSMKKLHTLIMTSSTYRMSKRFDSGKAELDAGNLTFWRVPYRRLEVEAIRDSMLAVSGQLNRKLFGPCMYPKIPEAALQSGYDPAKVWKPFDEKDASRRTIYAYVKRTLVVPFLETLDFCDTTQSFAQRNVTTVAPQALELLNGEFVSRQSAHFARRLQQEVGDDLEAQITRAYRLALARQPRRDELTALSEFVKQETASLMSDRDGREPSSEQESSRRARIEMCRVIFNLNEFVYTD
ncbi:MAG: PSD1 and planctomycete cytochrome C domain-containing protein [Pirellulaceae bacterium]|jgi:hypothetical protein|nr:PSD1 and planctomycete cytochrome C domain-containing protein [Pirellulaceae bacterium]